MTVPELSRRERKKDETRQRIFDAAIALFREHGFEATTVDEITEKADVGRGTFFNYFHRKEAVLAYLSEERLNEAEENVTQLLTSPEPVREKLLQIYRLAALAHQQDRDLARFVFTEWIKRAFAPTQEADARWQKLICATLAQGRERRELKPGVSDVRAESVLSAVYVATVYQWLFCPEDSSAVIPDLSSELDARLNLVIDGLEPRKADR
jgi:AcrR family transcriptional regulator